MRHLSRDLRYAFRGLARSPLFTAVALAVDRARHRREYRDLHAGGRGPAAAAAGQGARPARAVQRRRATTTAATRAATCCRSRCTRTSATTSSMRGAGASTAARHAGDRRQPAPPPKIFSGMFARRTVAMNVGVDGQTERVPGELVSGTYFQVLGVGAAIGRVITPDDDKERGGSPVAVLSYDYWRNRFGGGSAASSARRSRSTTTRSPSSACRRPASTASTSATCRTCACRC